MSKAKATAKATGNVEVLEVRELGGKDEYFVRVSYKGKDYSDAFSLPGLKKILEETDEKELKYIIAEAMIEATKHIKTAKAEEVSNDSTDN